MYVGLMTNLLLALACAPLLFALAIVRDPVASWPFFAVLSALCAPALAGAFRCFALLSEGSTARAPRVLGRLPSGRRPGAGVWAAATVLVCVLVLDAVVVAPTAWGPMLVPFFATATALAVALAVALLVVIAETPRAVRLRGLVLPCLYLVARRWYLSAPVVAVLGLAVAVILVQPVLGVLLATAPLLFVVWSTTRYVVAPVLPAAP